MPKGLRYADAVKVLGGSGPGAAALDNALGGALALATGGGSEIALSLFDAKAEMVRLGRQVNGILHARVNGLSRFDRSQRLYAAHTILVVTAFFEAVDEFLPATGMDSPEMTRDDQIRLAAGTTIEGSWLQQLLAAPVPGPSADRTYAALRADLSTWYAETAARVARHLTGLSVWDRADDRGRSAARELIEQRLPGLAVHRYEELTLRLAVDVPEFQVWTGRLATEAHQRSLTELHAVLKRATSGRDPDRYRAALAAAYRAELDRPVAGITELDVPTLGQLYVHPRFRVQAADRGARPADEEWWDGDERVDLPAFLAEYLLSPQAAEAPLMLLGQPGAGKSSLTHVLAARLPAADFLVVRVPLREVPVEKQVQNQVEQAVRMAIGESVPWFDLASSAKGALTVVLIDGFDELLQVTGAHQSDYLERVAEFQRREAALGRPAAVIVTSRIAVADRVRFPPGSLIVRLDGFDLTQMDQWLATWNTVRAHRPLSIDVAKRFPHLAEQPLLLLMLALYDATDDALRTDAGLDTADLYERLLRRFAEREVRRWHEDQPEDAVPDLVEAELARLSVVAIGMFLRSRQWITGSELDDDLVALGHAPTRAQLEQGRLTPGQEIVGRFFFIQRAQAVQDGRVRQIYEFLHATFGEYLVARLVVSALDDAELLRSLLGFVPLSVRNTILPFVVRRLAGRDRDALRSRLIRALRAAFEPDPPAPGAYRPVPVGADHRKATVGLNLLLLALACGKPVRASDLFEPPDEPADRMRSEVARWMAATDGVTWGSVLDAVTVRRTWTGGRRDLVLVFGDRPPVEAVDPWWTMGWAPDGGRPGAGAVLRDYTSQHHTSKSLHLGGGIGDDMMRHALEPITSWMAEPVTTFVVQPEGPESLAHSLIALWTASSSAADRLTLSSRYERAIRALGHVGERDFAGGVLLLLRLLKGDAARLPADDVERWVRAVVDRHVPDRSPAPDVLDCLAASRRIHRRAVQGITAAALRLGPDLDVRRWPPDRCIRVLIAMSALKPLLDEEHRGWARSVLAPHVRTLQPDLPSRPGLDDALRVWARG